MARPSPEERFRTYEERYRTYRGVNDPYYFLLRDFYREWTGTVTPGFPRKHRANGHTMFDSRCLSRDVFHTRRSAGVTWDDISYIYRGGFTPPVGSPYVLGEVSHHPRARQQALDRAMDKVRDQKVNLAQFLAERAQLNRLANDVVLRLTRAVKCIRRLDPAGASKALGLHKRPVKKFSGDFAKDLLAVQYGVRPLLADVKGLAEHFAEEQVGRAHYIDVEHVTNLDSPYYEGLGSGPFSPFLWTHSAYRTKARVKLQFKVTNDLQRRAGQLGFSDVASLAWELTPWSFVVDWAYPLGAFLGRLQYDSGLSFHSGWIMQHSFQTSAVRAVAWGGTVGGVYVQTDGSGAATFSSRRVDREILYEPPRPVLPGFKDPFSPEHTLNGIALLVASLTGGRKVASRG